MIKRLKWNVLYGGGYGAESDGGLTSSSEEDDDDVDFVARQAEANKVLQELAERDPEFAETLHQKLSALASSSSENEDEDQNSGKEHGSSSSDEEDDGGIKAKGKAARARRGVEEDVEDTVGDADADSSDAEGLGEEAEPDAIEEEEEEDPDQKYAEWRECDLCPGKRFLTDTEVEAHLSSKKHLRAVVKFEKRMQREAAERESKCDSDALVVEEEQAGVEQPVPRDAKPGSEDTTKVAAGDAVSGRDPVGKGEKAEGEKLVPQDANPDAEDMTKVASGDFVSGKAETEDEERKKARRKASTKRKLKALKRKKWEKKMKAKKLCAEDNAEQNGEAEDDPTNGEEQESHAKTTSNPPQGDNFQQKQESSASKKKKRKSDRSRPENEKEGCENPDSTRKLRVTKSNIALANKEKDMPESNAFAPEANGAKKRGREDGSLKADKKKKVRKEKGTYNADAENTAGQPTKKGVINHNAARDADEPANGATKPTQKKKKKKKERKPISSAEESRQIIV